MALSAVWRTHDMLQYVVKGSTEKIREQLPNCWLNPQIHIGHTCNLRICVRILYLGIYFHLTYRKWLNIPIVMTVFKNNRPTECSQVRPTRYCHCHYCSGWQNSTTYCLLIASQRGGITSTLKTYTDRFNLPSMHVKIMHVATTYHHHPLPRYHHLLQNRHRKSGVAILPRSAPPTTKFPLEWFQVTYIVTSEVDMIWHINHKACLHNFACK